MARGHDRDIAAQKRLLNALAEQIKLPLLQIARGAELARQHGDLEALDGIELTADSALKLVDSYLLSLRLAQAPSDIFIEPVSVAAVLNDAAHGLSSIAKNYGCQLELHMSGRYEPVMANRAGLEAALTSLGFVFIEAVSAKTQTETPVVKLAAHRGKQGIVAGTFIDNELLTADMYRRARRLHGRVRQPLTGLASTAGAGVFIADSLLSSMSAKLRIAHHQKLAGLAATFQPSHQLNLVLP
jgi:hypothetical protein